MSRKLFGIGAHGGLVGDIQHGLLSSGCNLAQVDEIYGPATARAVVQLQQRKQLPATGEIDDKTWAAFMPGPIPSLFNRCLELTAAFEAHSYTLAVGDFDGAWLTWGIVGFTMKFGKVQAIIAKTQQTHPELISQAFGENAASLIRIMNAPSDQQKQWAESISVNGMLAAPWRKQFETLGTFPEVQQIQRDLAEQDYFIPCLATVRSFNLKSEIGVALCFDIHVQNGSINSTARGLIHDALSQNANPPEPELLRIIANSVADAANAAYREDVRARKLTIATGHGSVHGTNYDLSNWGLGEFPADLTIGTTAAVA